MVLPVHEALQQNNILTWIDERNYPPGRDPYEVLREELLHCRHVIYFVTPALLRQGRGWTGIELGNTALIQQRLWYGSYQICHVELPLFFVPQNHAQLARSAYSAIRHKGIFYPPGRWDINAADWAARQALQFIQNEQRWALQIAAGYATDPMMQHHFGDEPGLHGRIAGLDPVTVPAP